MKIKTDSTIYKALKFANAKAYFDLRIYGQTTLCKVASGLIEAGIMAAISLIVLAFAIVFSAATLFTMLVSPFTDIWIPIIADELLIVTITGCCFLFVCTMAAALHLGFHHPHVTPKYLNRWLNPETSADDSILSRWLKDRRERICTIVKLEE